MVGFAESKSGDNAYARTGSKVAHGQVTPYNYLWNGQHLLQTIGRLKSLLTLAPNFEFNKFNDF